MRIMVSKDVAGVLIALFVAPPAARMAPVSLEAHTVEALKASVAAFLAEYDERVSQAYVYPSQADD